MVKRGYVALIAENIKEVFSACRWLNAKQISLLRHVMNGLSLHSCCHICSIQGSQWDFFCIKSSCAAYSAIASNDQYSRKGMEKTFLSGGKCLPGPPASPVQNILLAARAFDVCLLTGLPATLKSLFPGVCSEGRSKWPGAAGTLVSVCVAESVVCSESVAVELLPPQSP